MQNLLLALLCNDLHISSKLVDHDFPVPVDKQGSVKILPRPFDPSEGYQRSNI